MKIGIDARFLGTRSKGLGRYTEQLVRNLEALNPSHEFVIFMRKENWDEWKPIHPRFTKKLADFQWYSLEEQLYFPKVLREANCDLYHFPHFNVPLFTPKPFVVTIHDLILSHFPTIKATTLGPLLYSFKHLMYQMVMRHALKGSSSIIAVSEFTKHDVAKTHHIPEDKIAVTYEGVEIPVLHPPEKTAQEVLTFHHIQTPYLLYVGNAYPHKNLEFLIDGFTKLKVQFPKLSLVLVGKHDYFYKRLIEYMRQKGITDVIFPGYVPDDDLKILYSASSCYVFPSLYEGFGLPPLEAMSQGAPVSSSNSSCLPEILGSAAAYFSPHDLHDMIQVVSRVLKNPAYASKLKEEGLRRIDRYSWKQMALTTLSLYERQRV